MIITRLSLAAAFVASACLVSLAQAGEPEKPKPVPPKRPQAARPAPKQASPLDELNVTSSDSGDKVQQRLKLGLDKDKSIFLYGDRSTIYPAQRKPGEDYQPTIPLSQPKDSFGVGIGFGKRF